MNKESERKHKNLLPSNQRSLSPLHPHPSHPIHPHLMPTPLNSIQIHSLLHKFPQRGKLSQELYAFPDGLEDVIDLRLRSKPSNPKPNTRVCGFIRRPKSPEDIRRLKGSRGTSGAGGERDVLQRHQEGLALDVGERDVDAARIPRQGGAVESCVFHCEKAVLETLGEGGDAGVVVLLGVISGAPGGAGRGDAKRGRSVPLHNRPSIADTMSCIASRREAPIVLKQGIIITACGMGSDLPPAPP
jgi:hypothetical protein